MDAVDLFAVALNLPSPWHISQVEFKPSKESSLELHIYIAFQRGGRFPCPQEPCGKSFPAYGTAPRTWRHLNFFQYKTYIHADLPRIQCERHGVKTVQVPWAREALLKNSKYLWLKNEANLTESQRAKKETLQKKHLKTARAYAMRVEMQEIYVQALNRDDAEKRLKKLCSWMMHSRLEPMKKFFGTLRNHWEEILHYFEHPYTNAILEGLNSLIRNFRFDSEHQVSCARLQK